MNTCVLCLSRRKALQWTIRSRSRWNGVRTGESSSSTSRRAGYERWASGERNSSSIAEIRSRKAMALVPVGVTRRFWHEGRRAQAPPGASFPLLPLLPPFAELEPGDEQHPRAEVDRQLHEHVARVGQRRDHVFTADRSHRPRLV